MDAQAVVDNSNVTPQPTQQDPKKVVCVCECWASALRRQGAWSVRGVQWWMRTRASHTHDVCFNVYVRERLLVNACSLDRLTDVCTFRGEVSL